jgi:hypothetical protein
LNSAILFGKEQIILCSSSDEESNGSFLENPEGDSYVEVRKYPS